MAVRSSVFVFVLVLVFIVLGSISGRHYPAKRDSDEVSATVPHLEIESDVKPLSADATKDQNTLYFKPRSGLHEKRQDAGGSLTELTPHQGGSSEGLGNPVDEHSWIANVTCDLCKFILGQIQKLVSEQKTQEEIKVFVEDFCKTEKIETPRVCDLVIPQYMDMILTVIQGTVLSPDEICGIVLGDNCATPFDPLEMWNITISDKPKPPVRPHVRPKPGSPTLRFLHLTDIHLDIEYQAGADAECGEPLCCRAFDINPGSSQQGPAGGEVGGTTATATRPGNTLKQLFKHLSDIQDQFDYVIFTGDIPAHDVWNQTRPEQLSHLLRLTNLLRTYLPGKPTFACPGNHEGVPCNSFPPDTVPGQSMDWFYGAYLQSWGYWLPYSVAPTIMRGGFYTFSPFPGFRIISLNTNFGARLNWWLLLNTTDPQGQLQWLADVLQEAEDKGEKVHILSHFPPGEMLKPFAWNYYRLVNRYESTITGQFNGHTHKDEYQVFYDLHNKTRAVGMTYVGGSVTPFSHTNFGFRIYTMDGNYTGSSWEVLDYTHYYLDIPKANEGGSPNWQKEYSAMDVYQLKGLYPEDWSDLVNRMKKNEKLFQQYYNFYRKSAKHGPCEAACKRKILCRIRQARKDDPDLCKDL